MMKFMASFYFAAKELKLLSLNRYTAWQKGLPHKIHQDCARNTFPYSKREPTLQCEIAHRPIFRPSSDNLQVLPHKYRRDPQSFRAFCNIGPNHPRTWR